MSLAAAFFYFYGKGKCALSGPGEWPGRIQQVLR